MTTELNNLRLLIENMPPSSHEEIFNIIKQYNVTFTENTNGIFINMKLLGEKCLDEINSHIKWLNDQKEYLQKDELVKQKYKNNFF